MDPLTQILAGMTVARAFPAPEKEPRLAPAVWVGIVAASLPDIDVLLPPVVTGQKEEFMLFHRGWSHTLLIAPLLAIVAVAVVRLVLRWGWAQPLPLPAVAPSLRSQRKGLT